MLYVIRHGQTVYNERSLICGFTDSPLTQKGYGQASALGERLKGIKFDAAFSSPLSRAKETLAGVLEKSGNSIKIVTDARLKERNFGKMEGKNEKDESTLCRWQMTLDTKKYKMESIKALFDRVLSFLSEIKAEYEGKNVIVATHNGIMRMFKCAYEGFPTGGDLMNYGTDNTGLYIFGL